MLVCSLRYKTLSSSELPCCACDTCRVCSAPSQQAMRLLRGREPAPNSLDFVPTDQWEAKPMLVVVISLTHRHKVTSESESTPCSRKDNARDADSGVVDKETNAYQA
jgi:hypothetical protein